MRDQDAWLIDAVTRLIDAVRRADTVDAAAAAAAAEIVVVTSADVAGVVLADAVIATAGRLAAAVADADLVAATTAGPAAEIAGIGRCDVAIDGASDAASLRLVVVRRQGAISRRERGYLSVASHVLTLAIELLANLESERALRAQTVAETEEHHRLVGSLLKRQQLLDNLALIERSISARAPIGEVLSTIIDAVSQLLGDDYVTLRLLDPDDPTYLIIVGDSGLTPELFNRLRRAPVGAGAGGRAVEEDALVVIDSYQDDPSAMPAFVAAGVRAAVAAPVHENGVVVGSLAVATRDPARRYGAIEQETLLAFAEHVSLALTDARTVDAMHAAEQVKDNLLAMVSHELKTPLTVMLGVVQTIQRHASALSDDVRDEMLTSAQERGNELGRLIDRLLEGAKGAGSDVLQEASLPAVISAVCAPYAASGRHLLIPPVRPQPLRVDVAKLHGALTNLIDSAVRHSPRHTPVVIETDVSAGVVSVTVTAQGDLPVGIDPGEFLERSAPASTSGLGLGLYLAGHLASAIGGSVSVGSSAGMLSLTLRFPAGAQAATAARTRPVVLP